jgi:CO/xanthine dehydrogenase Mo-binding subunit
MEAISSSVARLDFDEKITGKAQYCADLYPEGMLYAKTLRSSKARAWLRAVRVQPLPKDYWVIDHRDIPVKNIVPIVLDDQPFFAEDAVNYIGEPILIVVGPDRSQLSDLIRHIKVNYEERPPVLTLEEAMVRTSDYIYGDKPWFAAYEYEKGDVDSAIRSAVDCVADEFCTGYQEQAYLEPQGMLAVYESGVITVRGSMQCPYYIVEALKQALGWDAARIRVVQLPTGGGFGGPQAFFAMEMHMEHIARQRGVDSVQLRRAHFFRQGDTTATGGLLRSAVQLEELTDIVCRLSDYEGKRRGPRLDNGKLRGIGCSVFFHGCGFTGAGERDLIRPRVRLRKAADGTVRIFVSSTEIGQGAMTTLAKIVAKTLDIPLAPVRKQWEIRPATAWTACLLAVSLQVFL